MFFFTSQSKVMLAFSFGFPQFYCTSTKAKPSRNNCSILLPFSKRKSIYWVVRMLKFGYVHGCRLLEQWWHNKSHNIPRWKYTLPYWLCWLHGSHKDELQPQWCWTTGGALHCQVEHHVQDKKHYFLKVASLKWVEILSIYFHE